MATYSPPLYAWFWWYYINRELRDLGQAKGSTELGDNPGLSTVALNLGYLVIIPAVWTIVTTTKRIQAAQRLVGAEEMSGWIAGMLWVFTLGIGGIIYTQNSLNQVWKTQPVVAPGAIAPPVPTADSDLERLKKLSELKESGALSEQEFEAEKSRLLPRPVEPRGLSPTQPGAAGGQTMPRDRIEFVVPATLRDTHNACRAAAEGQRWSVQSDEAHRLQFKQGIGATSWAVRLDVNLAPVSDRATTVRVDGRVGGWGPIQKRALADALNTLQSNVLPGIADPAPSGDADLERLKKLSELKELGAISDQEFEAEKAQLLKRAPDQAAPPPRAA